MKLNKKADIFIPDGSEIEIAVKRTTHLCIAAHQDDIEIFAWHGIRQCYTSNKNWFTGVVLTDGAGSPRANKYKDYSNAKMKNIRHEEQKTAAKIGNYSAIIQLMHQSSTVKNGNEAVLNDITEIIKLSSPDVVYLHNPADKHDTHVASFLRSIEAIRRLPKEQRPKLVLGCEVWRSLDWVNDKEKFILPHDDSQNIAASLLGVFDSQISGGKRYDLATIGRRTSNATYFQSHDTDDHLSITFAINLTPLIENDDLSFTDFTVNFINSFCNDVTERIERLKR